MAKGKLLMASLTVAALTACSGGSGVANEGRELSSEADRSKSMTMTGCLQAGDPAGTYVLRTTSESAGDRARRDDRGLGSGEEAIGTGGSGGTGGSSPGGRDAMMSNPAGTFRLIPGAGENLGPYLGQQVRVKGQIANDAGRGVNSEPNRGSGGGRIQPGAADQSTNARFFRVTEIDKVADRCAGGTADKDRQ